MTLAGIGRMAIWRDASAPAWALAGLAMVLILLAPALWNGFPLIFPDSGGYLARPLLGTLELGRSAFYGAFLAAGSRLDFWPNVLAQAALVVWLMVLTLRSHRLGGRPWLAVGIVLLLALATSLPLFAGQLMPDILFPTAVLALHLLAFRSQQLSFFERSGLGGVIVFAIAGHMATLAMAAGILASFWLLSRIRFFHLPRPRLTVAGLAVAAGIALCPVSNYAITGQFAFTPGGTSFLFARLLEDGIVGRYLEQACPDPGLRICDYRGELTREPDDWLWKNDTPFYKLGGWQGHGEEERRIILATIRRYPIEHLTTATVAALQQFIAFKSEVVINPWHNAPAIGTFAELTPHLIDRLRAARQQAQPFDTAPLNAVHVPVAALSIAGLIGVIAFRRRLAIAPETVALCCTVLLALAVNAAVCGIFAHPTDRYQSRLVPLAPLALAVALFSRQRRDRLGPAAKLA